MNKLIQAILRKANLNPYSLFLIDSAGALLSVSLYMTLLARFETIFGVPQNIVYILSLLAGIYAIYSGSCYILKPINWQTYLKIIAMANILHCILTLCLIVACYQVFSILGILYFVNEIIVVSSLVAIELRTISTNSSDRI